MEKALKRAMYALPVTIIAIIAIVLIMSSEVRAASTDTTPPVLKSITIQEQGQTLHSGDTLHVSAVITDNDQVSEANVRFFSSVGNCGFTIYLKYNDNTKCWEGDYTFKDTDQVATYRITQFEARDRSNNFFYIDYTMYGQNPEYSFIKDVYCALEGTSTDITPPVLKSITIQEQGQTLHSGDTLHVSAVITDNDQVSEANVRFFSSVGNCGFTIYLKYNDNTKCWEGDYTFKDTDQVATYKITQFETRDRSNNFFYIDYTMYDQKPEYSFLKDVSCSLAEGTGDSKSIKEEATSTPTPTPTRKPAENPTPTPTRKPTVNPTPTVRPTEKPDTPRGAKPTETPGSNTTSEPNKTVQPSGQKGEKSEMYRLYNPNSGEHFFTTSQGERNHLVKLGWRNEGIGWTAPKSGTPVYRLYNKNGGEHHYTTKDSERKNLIRHGWKDEGIGWYSGGSVPLYRQYNPNAFANNHNYTKNTGEKNHLIQLGWRDEGIAWYGVA